MSGNFQIFIDASGSQTDIKYKIVSIEENNKPHNLKFIFEEKQYESFKQMEEILSGIISAEEENKTRTFLINWEWRYETGNTKEEIYKNDLLDTEDMNNISKYNFTICVSGEQIKL